MSSEVSMKPVFTNSCASSCVLRCDLLLLCIKPRCSVFVVTCMMSDFLEAKRVGMRVSGEISVNHHLPGRKLTPQSTTGRIKNDRRACFCIFDSQMTLFTLNLPSRMQSERSSAFWSPAVCLRLQAVGGWTWCRCPRWWPARVTWPWLLSSAVLWPPCCWLYWSCVWSTARDSCWRRSPAVSPNVWACSLNEC